MLLDGRIVGTVSLDMAHRVAAELRRLKIRGTLPETLEVALLPGLVSRDGMQGGVFPMLTLYTGRSRLTRPVHNLSANAVEYIGPMAQPYLDIACFDSDADGAATHRELSPRSMLSVIASLVPFSDLNTSPRNMYQCQ